MLDEVEEELDQAERCLADAKSMIDADISDQAIASRLYYACYHAAKAALYSEGFNPRGHGGLISLFGEEIMDEETVTREDAKFLSRSQTRREQADYENMPINEDLNELLEETEKFIQKMKDYIGDKSGG